MGIDLAFPEYFSSRTRNAEFPNNPIKLKYCYNSPYLTAILRIWSMFRSIVNLKIQKRKRCRSTFFSDEGVLIGYSFGLFIDL